MSEHHLNTTNTKSEQRTACPPAAKRGRTAGAQSPHVVIRGETSPRKNTDIIQPDEPIAHIDWLAFTLTPFEEISDDPIPWLRDHLVAVFGLADVQITSTGKGWNGYSQRFNIGENAEYGLIAYGGAKQRGTLHVELNAKACALVPDWQLIQQWGETNDAKITRVDLAHDDIEGETVSIAIARAWHEAGEFTTSGRPPEAHLYDDLGSGKGKTLYIGNRANGKMLRVYEKGRQLKDPSSPWVRVELELRSKSRVIPWDVLTSPATYLAGGYPCLAYLSQVQDKIRTISKAVQITLASILQHLRVVGGKAINVLMQENGEDAAVLINAIRREGIPRRLANYSDFLPTVFVTSHGQVTPEGAT